MENMTNTSTLTTSQMAYLASNNLDVMANAIAAFNRKWGNLLSREECEDLVTEAYINACDAAHTFNPQKGSLRTWLRTIAHNATFNCVKHRQNQVRLNLDCHQEMEETERTTFPSDRLSRSERDQLLVAQWEVCEDNLAFEERRKARLQRECLDAAFHALSDSDQVLLFMRYGIKLGEDEMARQSGKSYGALRTALSRARDRFESELKARHYEDIDEWSSRYFYRDLDFSEKKTKDSESIFGGRSETNGLF